MRRLLVGLLVGALLLAAAPSVVAKSGSPTPASGVWSWVTTAWDPYKESGGNTFSLGSENATWTGTFKGSSVDTFRVVGHRNGALWATLDIAFDGSVGGKVGTLDMMAVARWPVGAETMTGTWVIIGGTGELASLHGQGTWTYTGTVGDVNSGDYAGMVKFGP